MKKIRLGKTELMVTKTSFGALPIQRVPEETAVGLLRRAYEAGINFFDTANSYTDSERKIGIALGDVRKNIIIATKSQAVPLPQFKKNIQNSLEQMKTDYLDILQIHLAKKVYAPGDEDGLYDHLLALKAQGVIRHIGITSHRMDVAAQAVESGLYETIQYPFSVLAAPRELELVARCGELDVGFIAMKAMAGGLIESPRATFAFLQQYGNVVPIYGVQRMEELEEWLALDANPPAYDEEMLALIRREQESLSGGFCRSCGYCMPCPVGIPIFNAARISLLMSRSPYQGFLTREYREGMSKIEDCTHCGTCAGRCPYNLDIPALLQKQLLWYNEFYEAHLDEAQG